MLKKYYFFFFIVFALSCNSEKKIYESDSDLKTEKVKKQKKALTKYNRLLRGTDNDAKLTAAINYFEKKDYGRTIELLEDILPVFKGTEKGAEVQYYYAYSNYNIGDYIIAGYQFRNFYKNYPYNKHTEDCAYMGALCYYNLSPSYSLDQADTEIAIKEFERFTYNYPNSSFIRDCNEKLDLLRGKLERKSYESAYLYYKMENFKSAIIAFETHLKEFPETTKTEDIHFYILKSQYLLAINSIETKKMERYKVVLESYIKFVDKFPKGKLLRDAEILYTDTKKRIENLNKTI